MRLLLIAFATWLTFLSGVGLAQDARPLKNLSELASFVQTYYQKPQPELIGNVIESLPAIGLRQRPDAVPPFLAFFSEVFAANPSLVPQWKPLIAKQDEFTKQFLERALALSEAGGVLTLQGHSTALNDSYWGAFFASGRAVFIGKLVEQLRYWDERDDLQLFTAGASAKWSLASNAQLHPRVRSILEEPTFGAADPRTRTQIAELLAHGPAKVLQDTAEVIKKQRQAGKWTL